MSLTSLLDADCLKAVDLAKRWLPQDGKLDVETLLRALFHTTYLKERAEFQELVAALPPPSTPPRQAAAKVPITDELRSALQSLPAPGPITPLQLFAALVRTPGGRKGLPAVELEKALKSAGLDAEERHVPHAAPTPRFQALRPFGRMLTDPAVPLSSNADGRNDKALRVLLLQLLTPRYRNAVLVGASGVGKTALIGSLAAKLRQRDPQLPTALHGLELLELSPNFPLAPVGRDQQGQWSEVLQLRSFLRALEENPGIVLYIDQFLPFLQTLARASMQQELLSWFSHLIENSVLGCIGTLHPREWAHLTDWSPSLMRRFRVMQLEPPSGPALEGIVRARAEELSHYYRITLAPSVPARAIALADQHLHDRIQPEKTLRLLEAACGRAALASATELRDADLLQAVEDFIGPILLPRQTLGSAEIYQALRSAIVGQDGNLRKLAQLVVAGRADQGWFLRPGPRGVFLFGGPTGVGKTETAIRLARLLGQGHETLVRIDCQNLQGSSSGWEAQQLTWRLLGVAPGYVGHVPGCRDGLLVRVRDFPECVLLLDEFEKADAAVGRLFLRILDEGKAQDSEGRELDFRRCFIILTSNAGVSYSSGPGLGFNPSLATKPIVNEEDIRAALMTIGLGQEFLARIQHLFVFEPLRREHLREVVEQQLAHVAESVAARGKKLQWPPAAVDWLVDRAHNQPNLGVRFILSLLRTAILDPLNTAVQAGEVDDALTTIELVPPEGGDGGAERRRKGDRLRLPIQSR